MSYIGQGKKDFWISRVVDPATNSLKIIKESPEKYKGNLAISVFFYFSPDFVQKSFFRTDPDFLCIFFGDSFIVFNEFVAGSNHLKIQKSFFP